MKIRPVFQPGLRVVLWSNGYKHGGTVCLEISIKNKHLKTAGDGSEHQPKLYLKIDGRMVYLWRAVDAEGEVLDVAVAA